VGDALEVVLREVDRGAHFYRVRIGAPLEDKILSCVRVYRSEQQQQQQQQQL